MADYTENMNLILPKPSETYNVEIANTNNKVIDAQMANKVNKETGKGLSANDFTDGYKNKLDNLENYDDASVMQSIEQLRNNKVNKETGKGLSSNDFTNEHKSKLEGLENYDDTEVKSDIQEIKSQYYTKEEIEKVIDKKEVEGTEIHIEDAKEFNMIELETEGKSEQATRSGKNKLNLKDIKQQSNCTVVVDDEKLTVTATGTGNPAVVINCSLEAGEYYLHLDNPISGINVSFYNNSETKIGSNINTSNSFTLPEKAATMRINSSISAGNYNLPFESLYINIGNTDLGYEEYGASPSPEFPSQIENVEGWNKFDKNSVTNGYYLNESGNLVASANYCVSDFIEVKEGEKYFIPKRGTTRTKYYLSDKTVYSNTWDISDYAQVITIPKGVRYIRFSLAIIGSEAIDLNTFQFTEGKGKKPYTPFNSLVIKDVGNNLFDNNKVSSLNKLSYENGIYSASDNDTRTPLQYKIQQYTENNTFLGATTQVTKVISNIGRYYFTGIKAEDAAFVKIANNGAVREFTLYYLLDDIAVGEKFTVVLNVIDTTIGASKFKDVMLLKGEITEADYEKHKSQTEYFPLAEPLRGLPNEVKDTIKEDGIHIRVGTGVFQAVTQLYESSNGLKYGINLLDTYGVNTENSNINILCDKAIGVPLPRKENIIYITNNRTLVIFGSADDTVETFNEKFAGAEYQYELAEEVIEPFTPEQQTAWNNVKAMKLFEGVNNITVNATIKPNIRLTYAQDLKKRIERIEQALASETVSEEVQNG